MDAVQNARLRFQRRFAAGSLNRHKRFRRTPKRARHVRLESKSAHTNTRATFVDRSVRVYRAVACAPCLPRLVLVTRKTTAEFSLTRDIFASSATWYPTRNSESATAMRRFVKPRFSSHSRQQLAKTQNLEIRFGFRDAPENVVNVRTKNILSPLREKSNRKATVY